VAKASYVPVPDRPPSFRADHADGSTGIHAEDVLSALGWIQLLATIVIVGIIASQNRADPPGAAIAAVLWGGLLLSALLLTVANIARYLRRIADRDR